MTRVGLVIPCYNEEARLPPLAIEALLAGDARLIIELVDDGSKDGTLAFLRRLAAGQPRLIVRPLPQNVGKAEAVRQGVLDLIARGVDIVGYTDADFATPPEELLILLRTLEQSQATAVIASRVARMGARIQRQTLRRILGRVFASFASFTLGAEFHDTQCGAKWFRVADATKVAFSAPFGTRWVFDVELLGRLLGAFEPSVGTPAAILEVPVGAWRDVEGSKLDGLSMARSLVELARMRHRRLS